MILRNHSILESVVYVIHAPGHSSTEQKKM